MRSIKRHLGLMIFLFAIIAPFNNCSPVNNVSGSGLGQQTSTSPTGLAIQYSGAAVITVPVGVSQFNITGTCSADIYPQTTIWWTIENSAGQDIWDSYIAGQGASTYLASCTNSQFSVVVTVPCATGLMCSGVNLTYTLHLHISGILNTGAASGVSAISSAVTLMP